MAKNEVYFKNHKSATKFPWSIYHRPLINDLYRFLSENIKENNTKVLVIGPGDFEELGYIENMGCEVSVLDIDPRVIESLKSKYGKRIKGYYLVDEEFGGYPNDIQFNIIYAKEVIEHIPDTDRFLKKVKSLLECDGAVWMSTPNYGFFLLPLIEYTLLELIARIKGFSRFGIHPQKFNKTKLRKSFIKSDFRVLKTCHDFWKLSLTIWAVKE